MIIDSNTGLTVKELIVKFNLLCDEGKGDLKVFYMGEDEHLVVEEVEIRAAEGDVEYIYIW